MYANVCRQDVGRRNGIGTQRRRVASRAKTEYIPTYLPVV